jgi:tetratricopeptide (TPR) repeat protein
MWPIPSLGRAQGRAGEAEALYRRAVTLLEQQWGPDHPCVAGMLSGLAGLCREQGREVEAEALSQRALHIREQTWGGVHPDVAETLHDLALLRHQQGKVSEACSLAERALSIRSQVLGEGHPKTVATQALAAHLRQNQAGGKEKAPAEREAAHQAETTRRALSPGSCEGDPVQAFLAACCELHPRAWSRSADLWEAYQWWVETYQERYPLSRGAFMTHLKRHGCRAGRTMSARIWRGIAIVKKEP